MGKMNYFFSICFILFLLFNCKKQDIYLNILTNDLLIYDAADNFNSLDERIQITVDYVKDSNVFSYYLNNKPNNYDIIIGGYYPDLILDSDNFIKLNGVINDKNITPGFVKDYYDKFKGNSIPYSIDFPVIVARKDSVPKEYFADELAIQDFINLSRKSNSIRKYYNSEITKIGFSPLLSSAQDIDFFFIFNSKLTRRSGRIEFEGKEIEKAFNFINNFDNDFNFGIEASKNYFSSHKKIDKNLFLEKKILSFDFVPFSKALTFNDGYMIFLIKDLDFVSLKNKMAAVSNKSFYKTESIEFIKYILSKNTQKMFFDETNSKKYFFLEVHVPIYPELISSNFSNDVLDNYINNLQFSDFIDNNTQKRFFKSYYTALDQLNKGLISDKEFIVTLNHGLNR
jgi:hypothetical protein